MYLLERLDCAGGGTPFDLEGAVAAQVARLVAVHEWELPPGLGEELELGLPSAVDLGRDGARDLGHYADLLARVIRRHEPRLTDVRVELSPSAGLAAPGLVVIATLAGEQGPRPFHFMLPRE